MIMKYIAGIFLKVDKYYTKDGFVDGEFSACFVTAVLLTSTLNLINAMVFYLTDIDCLRFNLYPVGVALLGVIGILTLYFVQNKRSLLDQAEIDYSKTEHFWMHVSILFMLSTWVLAPILYKMGL